MIKVAWLNGMSAVYHTGREIHIRSDGTVICYAIDTDGKPYHDTYKMPTNKVEITVTENGEAE